MTSISNINGRITIDGKDYGVGKSVSINNGVIYIDGKPVDNGVGGKATPHVHITIMGTCGAVTTEAGDVRTTKSIMGDVNTVSGGVYVEGDASGDISTVSGAVSCKNVGGDVSTISGSILHAKNAG